jgi:hypothetical protein
MEESESRKQDGGYGQGSAFSNMKKSNHMPWISSLTWKKGFI